MESPRAFSHLAAAALVLLLALFLLAPGGPVPHAEEVKLDAPYYPTPQAIVDKMLDIAEVREGDYVIDLGSGDGRIPITAAKRYGTKGMGVDINPVRVQEAKANAVNARVQDKVEFKQQNLFETDISKATVLTLYLMPRVNMELRPRILAELKPGTRVVSHAFDMGDWKPDRKVIVEGRTIYMWVVPEKSQRQSNKGG